MVLLDRLDRFTLPEELATRFKEISSMLDMEKGPWIGGGVLHRLYANKLTKRGGYRRDIDVFFSSEEQRTELIKNYRGKEICTKWPFQFVKDHFFDSPLDMIDDFDFTICQFATDGETIITYEQSVEDIEAKRLRVNPASEIRTASRLNKYMAMGYNPDLPTLEASVDVKGNYYVLGAIDNAQQDLPFEFDKSLMMKARLYDVFAEEIDGENWVFIRGYPMLFREAYIMVTILSQSGSMDFGGDERTIFNKYVMAWQKLGLAPIDSSTWCETNLAGVTKERLIDALR